MIRRKFPCRGDLLAADDLMGSCLHGVLLALWSAHHTDYSGTGVPGQLAAEIPYTTGGARY
jgi:hypothetical protein